MEVESPEGEDVTETNINEEKEISNNVNKFNGGNIALYILIIILIVIILIMGIKLYKERKKKDEK